MIKIEKVSKDPGWKFTLWWGEYWRERENVRVGPFYRHQFSMWVRFYWE